MTADRAAFHGAGWQPRDGTLARDVRAGRLWRRVGVDAEWATLHTVMLALPDPGWPDPVDWNAIQYLRSVSFSALRDQLVLYADVLSGLGIEVLRTDLAESPQPPSYNGLFVRDQFFATPEGVIVARMGSKPRSGEEREVTGALAAAGVPIVATVNGSGCFEGADALWATPRHVLIGIGNRTNDRGASRLSQQLAELGVTVWRIPVPRGVQHLLGLVQLVDHDLAILRADLAPAELRRCLELLGFAVVELPGSPALSPGQAMNFVVLGPRRVVMVAGWPEVERRLDASGVEVAATVHCPELLKAAGGLACATGVLLRTDSVPAPGTASCTR